MKTGFLRGRYIGENLMDYLDEHNEPALLISADFQKAFDSLEWDFIAYCLNLFNVGPSIINQPSLAKSERAEKWS